MTMSKVIQDTLYREVVIRANECSTVGKLYEKDTISNEKTK